MGQAAGGEAEAEEEGEDLGDEARDDVSARGFWSRRRVTVFDIRITDTDAPSYGNRSSKKIIEAAEKEKIGKYGDACTRRRRDFTPMVYSVDGMPGAKARAAEKRLASLLATKWKRNYADVANFVRVRMALAVVRSITLLLRTERKQVKWSRRAPEDSTAALMGRDMDEE